MSFELSSLAWKPFFQQQLNLDELESCYPARLSAVHRSCAELWSEVAAQHIKIALFPEPNNIAIGDWVLLEHGSHRPVRVLSRQSLIVRKAAGNKVTRQLIAANIDTLFIVSSCNQDFNESRLERYLILAIEAGIMPLVVLTKADECDDAGSYRSKAAKLRADLLVECCDARSAEQLEALRTWCGKGQTIVLVGSSGVGKSTITNVLCNTKQLTWAVRPGDSKGRHTTTSRSMHQLEDGGLLIDTPGIRELQLMKCESGIEDLFGDVIEVAKQCHFRDCSHNSELSCAIQAALGRGNLDERRWHSYSELLKESVNNSEALVIEQPPRSRKPRKLYRHLQSGKGKFKGKYKKP